MTRDVEPPSTSALLVPAEISPYDALANRSVADVTGVTDAATSYSGVEDVYAEAAGAVGADPPTLAVWDVDFPTALVAGPVGTVVVTTGLLDLLTEKELAAVFAHELAHIKQGHSRNRLLVGLARC